MKGKTVWTACVMSCFVGTAAWADVVMPPPEVCVAGSRGETCHWGPFCAPYTCERADQCPPGTECRSFELCTRQIDCGGQGGSFYVDSVVGVCKGGTGCNNATCQALQVCTVPAAPDADIDSPVDADTPDGDDPADSDTSDSDTADSDTRDSNPDTGDDADPDESPDDADPDERPDDADAETEQTSTARWGCGCRSAGVEGHWRNLAGFWATVGILLALRRLR